MRHAVGTLLVVIALAGVAVSISWWIARPAGSDLLSMEQPTVMVFIGRSCPISNRYAPELERIYARFHDRVAFQLVYPTGQDQPADIAAHVQAYGLNWPTFHDPLHARAALAGATVTPEAAVFDTRGELVYRGRIDDRWVDFQKARPAATTHDLVDAIEAVLVGRAPTNPRTQAVGCYISAEMKHGS